MLLRDDSWLSLTPEPERLLPEARAVLRSGETPPPAELLAAERAAAERLVLAGRRSRWQAWLRESAALAERGAAASGSGGAAAPAVAAAAPAVAADPTAAAAGPTAVTAAPPAVAADPTAVAADPTAVAADPTAASAALVRDVIANHDALVLGLPGERKRRRR